MDNNNWKNNKNGLSNLVIESSTLICKKYLTNDFKRIVKSNEIFFLKTFNNDIFKIDNKIFCWQKIIGSKLNVKNLNKTILIKIIKELQLLHKTNLKNLKTFDFLLGWNFLKDHIKDISLEEKKWIDKSLNLLSKNQVFLHNDLVDGNILIKKEKIFFIDFEYSGVGNEMFDVASFLTERQLNNKLIIEFVNEFYNGRKYDSFELEAIIHFSLVFWSAWSLYMYKITNKKIFIDIYKWKKKLRHKSWLF